MTTVDSRDGQLRTLVWNIQRRAHEAARVLERSDTRAVEVARSFGYWLGRVALDEREFVAALVDEMPTHPQGDFTDAEWDAIANGLSAAIDGGRA